MLYLPAIKNPLFLVNTLYGPPVIARTRITKHLFIDGTFHHPINFAQLLIIIFKDTVTSEYIPGFYILMSNKTEILYKYYIIWNLNQSKISLHKIIFISYKLLLLLQIPNPP